MVERIEGTAATDGTLARLAHTARAMQPTPGVLTTAIPALVIHRSLAGELCVPAGDSPSLLLVVAGVLRLHTPAGIMDYMPGQCSVSTIDTPERGYVLAPSPEGDLVALSLALTVSDVTSTMISLDDDTVAAILASDISPDEADQADAALVGAFARMLEAARVGGRRAGFLAGHLAREATFDMLTGSCGRQFLESVIRLHCSDDIYAANSWIKENYRQPFSVEELALRWHMSPSAFHRKFKDAVGMGPLQCQKRLRLTEARRLMLDEGASATEAAFTVGYESSSQFSRDYKRAFGLPPSEDVRALRAAPPPSG